MTGDIMRESDEITEEILNTAAENEYHWKALLLSCLEVATISMLNLGLDEKDIGVIADEASKNMKSAARKIFNSSGGTLQ